MQQGFTREADLSVGVASYAAAEAVMDRLVAAGCPVVDLLFASSGIEAEVVNDAETLEILAGVRLPVATTAHLIAMKLLSRDDERRPQDLVDLRALVGRATAIDLARARESTDLIPARGCHRGRNLADELERLVPRA